MNAIQIDHRKPSIIKSEIEAIDNLITRRLMWLNRAENRLKKTYQAVKLDTDQMEERLKDLRDELSECERNG
jgi:hypothetical protein